jgi:hypothetical protein
VLFAFATDTDRLLVLSPPAEGDPTSLDSYPLDMNLFLVIVKLLSVFLLIVPYLFNTFSFPARLF